MSDSMNSNQLQQLIDGELDPQTTRRLLGTLDLADADPRGWRKVATALIEDRLWQRSFQQLEANVTGASSHVPTPTDVRSKSKTATLTNSETPQQPTPCPSRPSWLVVAAGLLLAASLGFYAGTQPSPAAPSAATNRFAKTEESDRNHAEDKLVDSTDADQMMLADLQPEFQLELTDAMGVGQSSVPLYSARKLNQLPLAQRRSLAGGQLSDRQRQQLRQSGYQFQQNVDYLSGRLQDGRAFVVPVRTVHLSSGQ